LYEGSSYSTLIGGYKQSGGEKAFKRGQTLAQTKKGLRPKP